jgi:large subunit ribosomal protein L25
MEFATLTLMKRDATGKGSSRTLRMSGLVPGIIYGREVPQPIKVALELKLLKKAIEGKYKRNTVLNIQIEGEKDRNILAMLQDYQIHPSTRKVIHVDFITVDPGRELEIRVPLRTIGKAVGVTKGGLLMEILHEIPITCLPDKIPVEVELDVSRLDIGQSMKVSDLPLPEGARSVLPPEQPVVSVTTIKEEKEVVEAAPVEG